MNRRPTPAELDAWVAEQLKAAPDPTVDPDRVALLARLLGLTVESAHGHQREAS